jgi:hypothetical protein
MDERKRYCKNCGAEVIPDSKYCARCGTSFENILALDSQPQEISPVGQPKKRSRNWLVALVVVLLVVGVIAGIALIGNFTTSAGNTDYSSYYNSFSGQGWTITSPFIKGTDSQGNAAYIGVMRNETGNYSLSFVIHVFDTQSAAQNDYTTQVTRSISQGYTTADLSQLGNSSVGSTRMGVNVSSEWGGFASSSTFTRVTCGYDGNINKWVMCLDTNAVA